LSATLSTEHPPRVQVSFIKKVQGLFQPYRYKVLYGGRDSVKCLAVGTRVIMADGTLRPVEAVQLGEQVLGPDSQPRTVVQTTRGFGPLFRVRQTSGMAYVVNEHHLLALKKSEAAKHEYRLMPSGRPRSPHGRYPTDGDVVYLTPEQWLAKSRKWQSHFRGYRAGVLHFDKQPVLIDPYFLGVWLGDGTARELRITAADEEIIAYCQEYAALHGGVCSIRGKAENKAKDLGLYRKQGRRNLLWEPFKAYGLPLNKHIPQAYLTNTEEVRLALLAGLLDTDGYMARNGYVISQANAALASQIKYLADTLGFRTSITRYTPRCGNNGVLCTAYRIHINGDTWRIPCRVKRKQIRQAEVRKAKDFRLSEISIEPAGEGEWAGFELDGDHLFLLEDGTVTHNSWSIARALLLRASKQPTRVLCCRQVQNSLAESVHELLANQIKELGLEDFYRVLENEIVCTKHKSEFIYTGLAKHTKESMKSFEGIDIAWVEEAADVKKDSWDILEPTIRKPGSEIWVSFNPDLDTDETYLRFVLHPPPGAWVQFLTWRDNPWHSAESEMTRQAMQARSTIEDYENVWEGKPRTVTPGAVYGREVMDLIHQGRYKPLPYDPMLKVHTVWDLGWSGSCTIHLVQRDLSAIRIIGYLEGRHVRTEEWAALLKQIPVNWGWDWLPHDGFHASRQTGISDYDVLRRAGRRVRGQRDSIPMPTDVTEADGMRTLRQVFPQIYLHQGESNFIPAPYRQPGQQLLPGLLYHSTARLLECWKRFRYNVPRHGEPSTPVADEFKHACDGSRYMALAVPRMTNETPGQSKGPKLGAMTWDSGCGALG